MPSNLHSHITDRQSISRASWIQSQKMIGASVDRRSSLKAKNILAKLTRPIECTCMFHSTQRDCVNGVNHNTTVFDEVATGMAYMV